MDRPYSGIPWKTAPPLPNSSPSLLYNTSCTPYGCREPGWRGQYGGPFGTPEQDPQQNPCNGGISIYSVEDFQDVPVYFAGVLKHNYALEPLAMVFSSPENAYRIHREISRQIYEQTQINIAKQESQVLAAVMSQAFIGYRTRYKTNDIQEDITYLNNLVIAALVPRALANLKQQMAYLPLIDRVAQPIPLPVNLSKKGLDGRSGYDLGRFLP